MVFEPQGLKNGMPNGMPPNHIVRSWTLLFIGASCHWITFSILKWQHDFIGYSSDVDHVSSIWIKDLLALSMDTELKRQVDEQYRELDLYQQGGISYFKIVVDTVFKMSSMTEESLKSFIKDFGKNGLAKVPNENV
jgi:hypothetical protein